MSGRGHSLLAGAFVLLALPAGAATITPEIETSEDAFGQCLAPEVIEAGWWSPDKTGERPRECAFERDCDDITLEDWAESMGYDLEAWPEEVADLYEEWKAEHCGGTSADDPVALANAVGIGAPVLITSSGPRLSPGPRGGSRGPGGGAPFELIGFGDGGGSGSNGSGNTPTPPYSDPHPTPSVVPLPAAGWLLLSALGVLAWAAGWRRRS